MCSFPKILILWDMLNEKVEVWGMKGKIINNVLQRERNEFKLCSKIQWESKSIGHFCQPKKYNLIE